MHFVFLFLLGNIESYFALVCYFIVLIFLNYYKKLLFKKILFQSVEELK